MERFTFNVLMRITSIVSRGQVASLNAWMF